MDVECWHQGTEKNLVRRAISCGGQSDNIGLTQREAALRPFLEDNSDRDWAMNYVWKKKPQTDQGSGRGSS